MIFTQNSLNIYFLLLTYSLNYYSVALKIKDGGYWNSLLFGAKLIYVDPNKESDCSRTDWKKGTEIFSGMMKMSYILMG